MSSLPLSQRDAFSHIAMGAGEIGFTDKTKAAMPLQLCPCGFPSKNLHKAHLHWQKTKSKKTWVFCCTVYTARKTHNILGFGTKSACAKKPESHTHVLVSGAHARLLSTFDRTRVVRITSRAAVGWFRWRSRTTWPKTQIIPCEIGAGVYIGKKPVKFRRSFKKSRCGGGFFDSGFWSV